jgi:RNA-directed DNA polymerase
LNAVDQAVVNRLKPGGYLRYCDDFVLLDDDPGRLRGLGGEMRALLAARRLCLHEEKLAVTPVRAGLTFVGYRLWPSHRLLPKANVRRFRRRLRWMRRAYAAGRIGWSEIGPRLASWIGHARQADSQHLRERLSAEWGFSSERPQAGFRVVLVPSGGLSCCPGAVG